MERQVGVEQFEFDINTGIGTVTFDRARPVDLGAVQTTTGQVGFDLKWTEIEAVGAITGQPPDKGGALLLLPSDREQPILLLPGDTERSRETFAALTRQVGKPGSTVRVRGRARSRPGGPIAVTVATFEITEKGTE